MLEDNEAITNVTGLNCIVPSQERSLAAPDAYCNVALQA